MTNSNNCCGDCQTSDQPTNEPFECKECGLHYKKEETASKCQDWCKANKSCNLDIIKDAEEYKAK